MSIRKYFLLLLAVMSMATVGFSQEAESAPANPGNISGVDQPSPGASPARPQSNHVVVIMEENRSVNQAIEYMPYLRSLADQYGQGLQTYSDSHGSWLAYGELTSGLAPFGGQGDHGLCTGDGCTQTITIDNLVRRLIASGKTWRGYFESMPYIGYLGYEYSNYVRRHNPFAFYSDVVYSIPQQRNMMPSVPYMLDDIANNRLANFTWITPDLDHDAHNGTTDQLALTIADYYLRSFVPQLLASPPFQPGGDGVLLVTFDEGEPGTDNSCGGNPDPNDCGGHIWSVVIGPNVRQHYVSNVHYMQGSQFRMICDLLGVTNCPGDGAASPPMADFFGGSGIQ